MINGLEDADFGSTLFYHSDVIR